MSLYRIHHAWRRGAASSSRITYYENNIDQLKVDLLNHHLDAVDYRNNRLNYLLSGAWRKVRGIENQEERTTRILKVEKMVNDEWEPVDYYFIEPDVLLDGDRIGTERK